jgi:hypothetical protein
MASNNTENRPLLSPVIIWALGQEGAVEGVGGRRDQVEDHKAAYGDEAGHINKIRWEIHYFAPSLLV